MIKYLLILGVIVFFIYKIASFFFKIGAAAQKMKEFQEQQKQAFKNGANGGSRHNSKNKFKGGEYVDFEEVKK